MQTHLFQTLLCLTQDGRHFTPVAHRLPVFRRNIVRLRTPIPFAHMRKIGDDRFRLIDITRPKRVLLTFGQLLFFGYAHSVETAHSEAEAPSIRRGGTGRLYSPLPSALS